MPTTSTPVWAKTTTLAIGPTTPIMIAGLDNINHSGNKLDTFEVTDLSTPGIDKVFLSGLRDPGSISADGNYLPKDAGQIALVAAYGSGALTPFVITYPLQAGEATAAKDSFSGFVTAYSVSAAKDKQLLVKLEIKISGAITATPGA